MAEWFGRFKARLTGWILAALPALGMLGYELDPEAVAAFLNDWYAWLAGGYAIGGVLLDRLQALREQGR